MEIGNAQILGSRDEQQDYFASFEIKRVRFLIVADGMGGYQGGAEASQRALKTFSASIHASELKDIYSDLRVALKEANQSLLALKNEFPNLGTTLIALAVKDNHAWWISVGDSLLYLLRDKQLERINENHSVSEELKEAVKSGELTQEQAISNPEYHAITSALTGNKIPQIDCPKMGMKVKKSDRFLLASDGIHTLSDSEIEKIILRAKRPQQAADSLIAKVEGKAKSRQDNCTVITYFQPVSQRLGLILAIMLVCLLIAIGTYWFLGQELSKDEQIIVIEQSSVEKKSNAEQEPIAEDIIEEAPDKGEAESDDE